MTGWEISKAKDKENRRKHGIALATEDYVFDGVYFETIDTRRDYGELRLVAVGPAFGVGNGLLSVTYTWRGVKRGLISVRQASGTERQRYHHRHAGYEGGSGR